MQAALYMLLTWQSLVLFPLLIIDESWGRVATYVMLAGEPRSQPSRLQAPRHV